MPRRLRLYIDETGDHTSSDADDIGKRYLGLAGIIIEHPEPYAKFATDLEALKRRHLRYDPDAPPVLHRSAIIGASGAFTPLQDPAKRDAFDAEILDVASKLACRIIVVVIDKVDHFSKKYRRLGHPYHYGLVAMLERYCGWLRFAGATGDVIAESRGGKEDHALKDAYRKFYRSGSYFMQPQIPQATLTSKEIKIKPKVLNIAGLQLADIFAHPLTRDVLVDYNRIPALVPGSFAEKMTLVAQPKYNRQVYKQQIRGYGRILLA